MRPDPSRYAVQSDPERNFHFRRFVTVPLLTAPELERAADAALAQGDLRRADTLSWRAHMAGAEATT